MKFRKLRANEIDARVASISAKGCSLLLYKDARVDQNILDETVGPENWQRSHAIVGNNLYCTVSIWDENKKTWVAKQDVGTESYTEKEKGQASDSFKRACFNWGIGRELYTAPFVWVNAGDVKIEEKNGKNTTYDSFGVKSIDYDDDGNISKLEIINKKSHKVVFRYGSSDTTPRTDKEIASDSEQEVISKKEVEVLKAMFKRKGVVANAVNGKKLEALTAAEYTSAMRQLGNMPDKEPS